MIRAIGDSDAPALTELQDRPEVRDRIGSVVNAQDHLSRHARAIDVEGSLAGIVGLVPSGAYDGLDLELVCALRKEYEGRGLAIWACRRTLREALTGDRHRVLACVEPTNTHGKTLAERLGFRRIGTRETTGAEIWALSATDFGVAAV